MCFKPIKITKGQSMQNPLIHFVNNGKEVVMLLLLIMPTKVSVKI
jgi:hypothetical protein